jgi:hypothetical protein
VASVFPSVVSVVWTTGRGRNEVSVVSAGCVLHKFGNHTYILTTSRRGNIRKTSKLLVRFYDGVEIRARVLFRGTNLEFIVLRTEASHESSLSIQFREGPMTFSNALCVVPKVKSKFHKVQGFIPTPSCRANDMSGGIPEITNEHFIFVCQHHDTAIMQSAPVFHENSQVNGFIFKDCSLPYRPGDDPDQELIDIEAKICVKPRHIEAWLRRETNDNDWRAGLQKKKI